MSRSYYSVHQKPFASLPEKKNYTTSSRSMLMGFIIFMFRFRFVYNATSRSPKGVVAETKSEMFLSTSLASRRRHLHFNQRIAVKFPKSSFISMNSSLDDPSVAQLNNFQMG
jgi:hypothetical protein